ncbi:glycosyl hydrolase family 76-domain-containing protein [Massariosphaeria phaeospora]|uniref:mannan endo-1,6-alpha-mannosidase n=1 Tax=Massariosphaeria phaeospora TaxID=100035 RepID=A0A7C8I7C2_9PLEO|nr:glycosyl hydrolase family 76-domain-containing protein [Massariosphaeria phaeospora]
MRFISTFGAVLLPLSALVGAIELNPDDEASLKSVTRAYAHGLMSHYKNNATDLPKEEIGIFPKPHFWWAAGAAWGGMIEYTQCTGDESHVKTLTEALVANYGPNNDVVLPWRKDQEGNDDQAFWLLALMSALEYQFPDPKQAPASYLEVAEKGFRSIVDRWDESSCGGGLKWQIYPDSAAGYNYKNSISNGAVFALGARLARYTGNQDYADWSVKIYDWMKKVKFIGDEFQVFDGADDRNDCAEEKKDKTEWSYNNAMMLQGSAFMYDFTNGDGAWKDRTSGFLDRSGIFFKPDDNSVDIMYEPACETGTKGRVCNIDQQSFKAYLSRMMAKCAIMAPFTKEKVTKYLRTSAVAAAKSCSGGQDGITCGSKWYTGSWDGTFGVGQQLSALEVTQALLMIKQNVLPSKGGDSKPKPSSTPTPTPTPEASSTPAASSASSSEASSNAPASDAPASETPSATDAPSTPDSTGAPSTPSSIGAPSVPDASSAPVPVNPNSPSNGTATAKPDGQYGEALPTGGACTCTPTSTTTIYLPPTAPTAVPVVPPPSPPFTTGRPVTPPTNSTKPLPEEFTGAAVKMTGVSMLGGAIVVAFMAALL